MWPTSPLLVFCYAMAHYGTADAVGWQYRKDVRRTALLQQTIQRCVVYSDTGNLLERNSEHKYS